MKKEKFIILMKTLLVCVLAMMLSGCVTKIDRENKLSDLDYTVVPEEDVPEELKADIMQKEKEEFYITYADQGYLFLARGYGTQPTSGYSISVTELYDTKNAICFQTSLIGPKQGEETKEVESYPYIVIKMEYMDKEVVFD